MSNGISPVTSMQGCEPTSPAAPRIDARSGAEAGASDPAAAQAPPCPNPSLRIDGALGLVVIEFHDRTGQVATSIPTARQLDAYRTFGQPAASAARVAQGQGTPGQAEPEAHTTPAQSAAPASPAAAKGEILA